jgi:hypothetical protein
MAAEKKSAGYGFAKGGYGVAQSHAIAFGIAGKRRSGAPLLAKGEIAAENDVAIRGEAFSQRHEQGSIAIRACAVGQDEGVAVGIRRRVQEAAHGGHERVVEKWDNGVHHGSEFGDEKVGCFLPLVSALVVAADRCIDRYP